MCNYVAYNRFYKLRFFTFIVNISIYLCDDFSPLSVLVKCYLAKLIGIR